MSRRLRPVVGPLFRGRTRLPSPLPRLAMLAAWALLQAPACGSDPGAAGNDAIPGHDAGDASLPASDGGLDARSDDAGPEADGGNGSPDAAWPDGGAPGCPTLTLPSGLTDGMLWVRTEPMFISGLIPSMGAPSSSFVTGYLDDFGANAVHLWQDGLPGEMDAWRAARPRWLTAFFASGGSSLRRAPLTGWWKTGS